MNTEKQENEILGPIGKNFITNFWNALASLLK